MISIRPTEAERAGGALSEESVAAAVAAVRGEGFVVIEEAVDLGHIRTLREKLLDDLAALRARPDAPYNWNTGNIQQEPPPFPPYLFRDILVNEFAIQVTSAILGPGLYNGFYSGNTALPSESRQPVHADGGQLWPNLPVATPAFGFVVNVPLVEMNAENGSTEIWPGTHLDTSVYMLEDIKVKPEALERRRRETPPIQPEVRAGSILIRDIRLWHAGMPNRTSLPRPMIAMIHWAAWYGWSDTPKFSSSARPLLDHPVLKTRCEFVDDPIDYIASPKAYEYEPEQAAGSES